MGATPDVGVFRTVETRGINHLAPPHIDKHGKRYTPVPRIPCTLREALETEWDFDAFVTLYCMVDDDGLYVDHFPRMNKPALAEVRQQKGNLLSTAFGLDWDMPGHADITEEAVAGVLSGLQSSTVLSSYYALYTTAHGMRLMYMPTAPVPVDDAEGMVRALAGMLLKAGIETDQGCCDWTRLYRLPRVLRSGRRTSEHPLYYLDMPGHMIDPADLPSATPAPSATSKTTASAPASASADYVLGRMPDSETCDRLLYKRGDNGRPRHTFFLRKAKQLLKQSHYYDHLFEEDHPWPQTGRNNYLMQLLGHICPILVGKLHATPEQVYALLHGPICQWLPQPGKQDPHEHAWNAIGSIVAREKARAAEDDRATIEALTSGQRVMERMAAGMAEWAGSDVDVFVDGTREEIHEYVRHRTFANVGRYYYPLGPDGWYRSLCLMKDQLVPRIRKSYLDSLIVTSKATSNGTTVDIPAAEIVNAYSTAVHEVRMSPEQGKKGRIEDMDGDMPILHLPMYQRNDDLGALFDSDVDEWLRVFFGENYDKASEWLGYALSFEDGPICALSICSPSSTGKKMLARGLSECLVDPEYATGEDVTGNFNGKFLQTPFLHVNEGWPKDRSRAAPSDVFKGMTAGDAISVREMYRPRVNVLNPMRILLTANDHDLLYELTRGKELTPESRNAIGERILHFDIDGSAAQWLTAKGGPGFTAMPGRRWVKGDNGAQGDYIVARHLLWLYENRPKRDYTRRLCVMGNCATGSREMFAMSTQSDAMPAVMRAVVGIVEAGAAAFQRDWKQHDGRLYFTMDGIRRYAVDVNEERGLTEKQVASCVRSLLRTSTPWLVDDREYHELDTDVILDYVRRWGIPAGKLREITRKGQ